MALEGYNLGTAYGSVVLDVSGIKDSIATAKNSISDGLASIGDGVSGVGRSLTGLGANLTALGAPFLAFGGLALKSFTDSKASLAQLDATLKSTGGSAGVTRDMAIELASSLQKVTNFSDEAVLGGENLLLTFTNIGKDVFPDATQAILDMSTAMGQDLKSSAVQIGKALNDPIKGMTALQRVGVTFTQQQKDMVAAMVKSGNTMGAQKLILAELNKEFGGSAEAMAGADGGAGRLANKFDDLMETIGARLMPVLTSFVDIGNQVIDWFTTLDPTIQDTIITIGTLLAGLAVAGPILMAVGAGLQALGGVIAFIASPIGLLIAAVAGLFLAFQTNFLGIRDFLQPIIDWFKTNFGDVFGALWAGVPPLQIVSGLLYRLLPEETATSIKNGLKDIKDKLDTFAQNDDFTTGIAEIAGTTGLGLLIATISGPAGLLVAIGGAVHALSQGDGGLQGGLSRAGEAARQLVTLGLIGLGNGLSEAAQSARNLVGAVAILGAETLVTASDSAQNLVNIGLILLVKTLDEASRSADKLVKIVGMWVDQNRPLLQLIMDIGISMFAAQGIIAAYGALQAAMAAGATARTAFMTWLTGTALPLAALTVAILALIEAWRKLNDFMNSTQQAITTTGGAITPWVKQGGTLKEYEDALFAAIQSQFGDLAARLIFSDAFLRTQFDRPYYLATQGAKSGDFLGMHQGGQAYMVGTGAQPQLFIPSGDMMGIPNADKMMGGVTIGSVYITANSAAEGRLAAESFEVRLQELLRARGG